ncbi:MAG: hypothetical protein M1829_006416 [Trizodia sp. TS-e1964]|nr:MAG: hypothetical protein M1829_006416 [Trizodia sp. TS-e1964]
MLNPLTVSLLAVTLLARLSSASPFLEPDPKPNSGCRDSNPTNNLSKRTLFPQDKTPTNPERAEVVFNNADLLLPAIIQDIQYARDASPSSGNIYKIANRVAAAPLAPYTVYGLHPIAYVLVPVPLPSHPPNPPAEPYPSALPPTRRSALTPRARIEAYKRRKPKSGMGQALPLARLQRVGVVADVADFELAGREAMSSLPMLKGRPIGLDEWYCMISYKLKAKKEWRLFAKYGLSTYPVRDV